MRDRLELPPALAALCRRIADPFAHAGYELYLVGGIVRDLLLGAPVGTDVDFATDALPEESRLALAAARPDGIYDVGKRFGTMGAVFGSLRVEVTTYRAEAYAAGSRKPEVAFGRRLEDDLARRDFTINAVAAEPLSGRVVDPLGGRVDLARHLLRAVGDPRDRLLDDPLRLLRAVRFASRLQFEIDPDTASAVHGTAAALGTISRERVRDELDKIVIGPAPALGIGLLCDLGLAEFALPELLALRGMRQETGRHKDVFTHTLQVVDRSPPRLVLRWAALLHDIAKPRTLSQTASGEVHFFGHDALGARIARRMLTDLHQPHDLIERASRLVGLHLRANAYDDSWTDGAVRRFVREVGEDLLDDVLALSRADVTTGRAARRMAIAGRVDELEQRILELSAQADIALLDSPLDGNALMALFDRGPGPWIRPIKDRLRELVIDGELDPDDRETATGIARQLYAERPHDAHETARLR